MTFKTDSWGTEAKERGRKRLDYFKRYSHGLRKKILEKFGSKCIQCGFNDIRALQVDHINGGGCREWFGLGSSMRMKAVLNDKENKYQLLCANCNWIKRAEKGEIRK